MVDKLLSLFTLDEKPIDDLVTPSQKEIYNLIVTRKHPRNIIIMPTQYGKSFIVGLGILTRAIVKPEKWLIVAPSEKKARIIMGYIIGHIFDNIAFTSQLEISEDHERLKREKSKNKINFKRGGEVEVLSLDANNSKRKIESAMGHGAANVVLDESSLIDDLSYATVKRMLGGFKDNFLLEIGNPFYRNHFYKTWYYNEKYNKIFIDYQKALEEGRFTQEFIDEMRDEAYFDVFYECVFPPADSVDTQGYSLLLSENDLHIITEQPQPEGEPKLGVDIGGGGDLNVYCVRYDNVALIISHNKSNDTMVNVEIVEDIVNKYGIKWENVNIDDIGIGRGLTDRLKEKGYEVNGVSVGEKARENNRFLNLKAELAWSMSKWVRNNYLVEYRHGYNSAWQQLTWFKKKVNSDKVMKLKSKEEMKKETGKSPDFGDSLLLTFYERPFVGFI